MARMGFRSSTSFGAMAVQRVSYCTVKIQQHPIAVNGQVFYSHAYSERGTLYEAHLTDDDLASITHVATGRIFQCSP